MGLVQSVDVDLVFNTRNLPGMEELLEQFAPTKITVKRTFGGGGSEATLTGTLPKDTRLDPEGGSLVSQYASSLAQVTDPTREARIGINLTTQIGDADEIADRIYTGTIVTAKRNSRREVTFELLDRRELLNRKYVQLDTRSEGEPSNAIVRNLFQEIDGLSEDEYIVDLGGIPDIPEDVPIGNLPEVAPTLEPSQIQRAWGVGEPVPLYNVLRDIASIEDATLYIDRFDRINIRHVPALNRFDGIPYIKRFGEDSQQSDTTDVIVESGYDETGLGVFNQVSTSNQKVEQAFGLGSTDSPARIDQPNVADEQALEKQANSRLVRDQLQQSAGTLELLGQPYIHPNDQITLTDVPAYAPVSEGTFTAKQVTHTFDTSNGYTTTLELGESLDAIYDALAEQSDIAARKSRAIKSKRKVSEAERELREVLAEVGEEIFKFVVPELAEFT